MKISVLLAGVLLTTASTSAMAAGPYIGAAAGVSLYHDSDLSTGGAGKIEYRTGRAFSASLGYNFDGFRFEGEAGYKHAYADTFQGVEVRDRSMDTTISSYMANAYWDVKTKSAVTPFLGAGIGVLHGRMTDAYFAYNDHVPGYQFSAGTGIKITDNLNLDLSYRYQKAAKDFFIGIYDVSYASSSFLAGARYNF